MDPLGGDSHHSFASNEVWKKNEQRSAGNPTESDSISKQVQEQGYGQSQNQNHNQDQNQSQNQNQNQNPIQEQNQSHIQEPSLKSPLSSTIHRQLPSPFTQPPSESHSKSTNGNPKTPVDYYIRFRVHNIDRNRKDILIKFDAETNLTGFRHRITRGIQRTYTEFERFYEHLVCANPECIVPALPLYISSALSEDEADNRLRSQMHIWLNRIAEDVILTRDIETQSFIETDFGYQPMQRPRRRTKSSISKAFAFSKSTIDDDDQLLSDARVDANKLEATFSAAYKSMERLVKARKGLSACNIDLGSKIINCGSAESHIPLANGLKAFGKEMQAIGDIQMNQAIVDAIVLSDYFAYATNNAHALKETLETRVLILQEYENAIKLTVSKRKTAERLKSAQSLQPYKVDDALADLEEAQTHEQELSTRLATITKNLGEEIENLDRPRRRYDTLLILKDHVRRTISLEKQIYKNLEILEPQIKGITSRNLNVTYLPTMETNEISLDIGNNHSEIVSENEDKERKEKKVYQQDFRDRDPLDISNTFSHSRVNSSSQSQPFVAFGSGSMRRTNVAARSVYVAGHDDERVDAKMAASTLANMF